MVDGQLMDGPRGMAMALKVRFSFLVLGLIANVWCSAPQAASQVVARNPAGESSQSQSSQSQSSQRKTSDPYTGDLSIFESPGRDEWLQINRVMDLLGIAAGKSVADIGAGSGWFTVRAAKRVGESGQVYAVDINPEAIQYISERVRKEQLPNVKTIVSKPDDPLLPAGSVDAVLMLKTYHEVAHPVVLLSNLRAALRPGAKVGVIDRNGNGEDHGVGSDVVIREAKEAGYRLAERYDFVKGDKMDYFLVFTAQ
jgi:SAM-dependent methyltransferase